MTVTGFVFLLLAALTLSEAMKCRRPDFSPIKRLPVSPAGHFHLKVNPREISPGLTESLTVNCTFSLAKNFNMPSINSLIVSKSMGKGNQQEQFLDLATLHLFAPDNVNRIANVDGNVSGHIDDEGESFLSIKLPNPTANESGLFRCRINGIDNNGHPKKMYKSQFVTSQQPNLYQLRDDVNQLQRQFERLGKLTKEQREIISAQKSQLDSQKSQLDSQKSQLNSQKSQLDFQKSQLHSQKSQLDFHRAASKHLFEKFFNSSEREGHYYFLSKEDWQDATVAVKTCEDHGLYLVEINDESEFMFLSEFLEQHVQVRRVLVSGTYEKNEGHWIYQRTGMKLEYVNWAENEPDNRDDYSCIIMKRDLDFQWKWNDAQCTHNNKYRKFVCELET